MGDIRRTTLSGVVDTGAVSLFLPTEVVERLRLKVFCTIRVSPTPTSAKTSSKSPDP